MPGLNGRLRALANKAEKVLGGVCQCPGGVSLIRVGQGRDRHYRVNIAPGKPIPPPDRCKSCGRERLQVVVRYVKRGPVPLAPERAA